MRAERAPVLLFVATDGIGAATVVRERTPRDAATLAPDQVEGCLSMLRGVSVHVWRQATSLPAMRFGHWCSQGYSAL